MRSEAFQDLLAQLDSIELASITQENKDEFRRLICQVAVAHGVGQGERISSARDLLNKNIPRSAIKDRLMTKFGVGRSQAYRDIDAALQIVPRLWDADQVK